MNIYNSFWSHYGELFTDLLSQSPLQLIQVNDGVTGVQQVQLAVEGILQHVALLYKHLPNCIQELSTPVYTAGHLQWIKHTNSEEGFLIF